MTLRFKTGLRMILTEIIIMHRATCRRARASVGNSVAVYNTGSVIQYRYSLLQCSGCIPCVVKKIYNTVYACICKTAAQPQFGSLKSLLGLYVWVESS
jgi:hypothetical protein